MGTASGSGSEFGDGWGAVAVSEVESLAPSVGLFDPM